MDTTNLVAYLPFDDSPTFDWCGNEWTLNGTLNVDSTNAISGNALQLTGNGDTNYLQLDSIALGGRDFTIHAYVYSDPTNTGNTYNYARFFAIYNPNNMSNCRISMQATKFEINGSTTGSITRGTRHHVAIVYLHSTSTLLTFCDGVKVGTKSVTFAAGVLSRIYIGKSEWSGYSYLTGCVDEFVIHDGIALWTDNFTPPTAEDYDVSDGLPIDYTFDVQRRVKNALLTWRYENAGDANDLILASTVLTDPPATKSKTGTAFYQTTRAKCFDLPATPEIWLKFDVYFDGSNRWRAFNGGDNSNPYNVGVTAQNGLWIGELLLVQNSAIIQDAANVCKKNQLQTVLLHMISGSSAGIVEAWVDGTKIYTYTGNVNNGEDFADIYLQSDGSGTFFSNVIISNAEIGLDEDANYTIAINFVADLSRRVTRTEDFTADLQRTFYIHADFTADLQRTLVKTENYTADLQRNVTRTEDFIVDLQRRVVVPTTDFTADLQRRIVKTVDFRADLQRTLVNRVEFSADLQRRVVKTVNATFDLQRKLQNYVDFTADLQRSLINVVDFTADLQRTLIEKVDFTADLQRRTIWQWLTRILPDSSFLDSKMYASAEALDAQITAFHLAIREVLHLPRLDELSGTILDLLAEQFHVDAYDAINFSDEEKRNLIRQSIAWHRLKGTPAAVEMVLQDAFKDLRIDEWFTYGGEPYYFRLWCRGYISTPERFKSFWLMFMDAKNVRSHLEMVTIDMSPENPIQFYTGVARAVSGLKTTGLPRPKDKSIQLYTGIARINAGQKYIGLPKRNKILKATILTGTIIIRTGTIFSGMKHNPIPPDDDYDFGDGDWLRLYFDYPTGRDHPVLLKNPREDLINGDIKNVGDYAAENVIFTNQRAEGTLGVRRAALIRGFAVNSRTDETLLPNTGDLRLFFGFPHGNKHKILLHNRRRDIYLKDIREFGLETANNNLLINAYNEQTSGITHVALIKNFAVNADNYHQKVTFEEE